MTTVEEIKEIIRSEQCCHPSREDAVKSRLCIEALARRMDDIIEAIDRLESKIYEADE